jgi:uncharacterized LabA/DUF88 family protein
MKTETIYAFIDAQNLNLGVGSLGWKLDWRKFRLYLRNKYNVPKAYLFIGYKAGNEALYTYLQQSGYIVIMKPTMELPDGRVKGNVDAELVLHSMIEYPHYSKAIIVSGDGDFYCLIEYLCEKRKLLKVSPRISSTRVYFTNSMSMSSGLIFCGSLSKLNKKGPRSAVGRNLRLLGSVIVMGT